MATALAIVQHCQIFNLYGDSSNKWWFWGIIAFVLLLGVSGIGLILMADTLKAHVGLFLLPASFFALVSGALLGMSLNFFADMLPPKQTVGSVYLGVLAPLLLLCSSVSLGYIGVSLETLRDSLRGLEVESKHLRIHVENRWKSLWISFLSGIIFLIIGLIARYAALR